MNIAIVGSGAMGTLMGHGFCRGGYEVTMIDLPGRVSRLQVDGRLIVISPDGTESSARPERITADYRGAGRHDIVVLACKAYDLATAAASLAHLTHADSTILTIQNGIPWWYLQGEGAPADFAARRIACLDPAGVLEKSIDPSQILGCVAYPAAILQPDGKVQHVEGYRYAVGELDGSVRERTRGVSRLFEDSGFKCFITEDIRSEIWLKAWGALSINPISALTGATMEAICTCPETLELVAQMMREAQEIAEQLGATFRHSIEKRIEGARAVGPHKTSMLQDVEAGRPLELDALMKAVLELAALTGKEAPAIRHVHACTALLNDRLLSALGPGRAIQP